MRTGKIARLPRELRHQLNTRLADGAEGKDLLPWLNALPEVKTLLAEKFAARPITDQNLSEWRQGGYEEWLTEQNVLAFAKDLTAHRDELQNIAPGQTVADHLAAAVAFRYAAILAAQGSTLDESALAQLRSLGKTCQAVVQLRRSEQNAARLKIETERWELARPNLAAENAEHLKRLQRDALAAPVRASAKVAENIEKFGAGPAGRWAVEYLREIESCPDPANFQSKILTPEALEAMQRHAAERAKNPPAKLTDVEAAHEMLWQIDQALKNDGGIKPPPGHKKSQPRRTRKPAKCRSARPRRRAAKAIAKTNRRKAAASRSSSPPAWRRSGRRDQSLEPERTSSTQPRPDSPQPPPNPTPTEPSVPLALSTDTPAPPNPETPEAFKPIQT
jgi:hypothetical protein